MPGVPSNRGCDACRAQKKKCDIAKSPCPRCERLGIPCIGRGQQRFKFRDEGKKLTILKKKPTSTSKVIVPAVGAEAVAGAPSHSLSNHFTRLISAFVEGIRPSADFRYGLLWSFGTFLGDVPRRLGTNEALDAAADVLVTAHVRFCRGNLEPNSELLVKQSRALNALRHCLNDPAKAYASETLCSIMLLMTSQVFFKPGKGSFTGHPEGAARILRCRGYSGPQNDFESQLLLALRGPVVVDALFNSKIRFSRQEWRDLVENGLDGGSIDGEMIRCLARVPELIQRGEDALHGTAHPESTLLELRCEVFSLREDCNRIIQGLRDRLGAFDASIASGISGPAERTALPHFLYTRSYGLGLAMGLIANSILGALEDESFYLREESLRLSNDMVQLAAVVMQYRPLGSMSMIFCLNVAWIGATDADTKNIVEEMLMDYERACWGTPTSTAAHLEQLKRRFALQEPRFHEFCVLQAGGDNTARSGMESGS